MVQPFVPRPIVALANFGAVEGERLSCSATVRYTECSVLSGELKNPMARLPVSSIKPSASLRESKERMSMTMLSWVCAHARVPLARSRRGRKHGAQREQRPSSKKPEAEPCIKKWVCTNHLDSRQTQAELRRIISQETDAVPRCLHDLFRDALSDLCTR